MLPILLPTRFLHVQRIVFRPEYQDLFALYENVRDIYREGGVAAFMRHDIPTVNPDFGSIIHCAEMEDDPRVAPSVWDLEPALVPGNRVVGLVFYPG